MFNLYKLHYNKKILTLSLIDITLPVKIHLNKKLDSKQKTIPTLNIDAKVFRKTANENPPDTGNRSYQLTSVGRSANHGQIGWHWLAGNSKGNPMTDVCLD